MLSDTELTELLKSPESDRVERKASAANLDRIREAICAFANDLPNNRQPGVIFVGIDDNGTCAQLSITDALLLKLAGIRSEGTILPLPSMQVQRRTLDGCDVAVIEVQPSDNPPVRYSGRVWIRIGPSRAVATPDEERRLTEKRRAGDLPFDRRAARGSSLSDLDLDVFRRIYLPSAVAPEILEANQRTVEQQLASLHFLAPDGTPNHAAIIVLGREPTSWIPGSYVQLVRFEGTDVTAPIRHQQDIVGPLPDVLRALDDVLKANISVATSVVDAPLEMRRPDYPLGALQQLVRNGVMHRNYESSNAPVRVYWYTDRVEIQNPGGPFGQVTDANFGQPGVTDYRNPQIAEAMRCLGYVQRFGVGISLARQMLQANGNPPLELQPQANNTLVVVRSAP